MPDVSTATPDLDHLERPADEALTVTICGESFTCRGNRPVGAFTVFCARIKSSDRITQASAPVMLLKQYIVEDDAERLDEALSQVDDLEQFMSTDFAQALEVMLARPTSAP